MKMVPPPTFLCWLAVCLSGLRLHADVLYTTGFEASQGFATGSDKIVGTNNWLGTTSAGTGRSGIDAETTHGVVGLGNAGWLGGNTTPVTWGGTSTNVRRPLVLTSPFYLAPVTVGKEVVFISTLVGIKDSSGSSTPLRRDNFELFIMNGATTANGVGDVLGAIQFDNTTLDTSGSPQQIIKRSQGNSGLKTLSYASTGAYFIYDTMQLLTVRINFRTNRWTATLDGVPLFNDDVFYIGSGALNLGAVGFRMNFGQVTPVSGSTYTCVGGSNYILFDDLIVQADAPALPALSGIEKVSASSLSLTWNAEAAYLYQVFGSPDLKTWSLLTPAPIVASQTSNLGYTDTSISPAVGKKFYKIVRTTP